MHESEVRGKLMLNGKPMPDSAICRMLGLDNQIVTSTIKTLLEYGVASRCEATGALISRRMLRDEDLRQIRKKCGKLGGNPNLVNQIPTTQVNQIPTTQVNQIPTPSSSSSFKAPKVGLEPPKAVKVPDNWNAPLELELPYQDRAKTVPIIPSLKEILTRSTEEEKKDPPTPLTVTKRNKAVNRFVKPTMEEVAEYLKGRNSPIDPRAFYGHYESNGWMVGKNPVKSWKACVVTWECRMPASKVSGGTLV
jgi:hypothetical protein